MKIATFTFILLLIIGRQQPLCAQSHPPRVEWQQTVGGASSEWPVKVIEMPDGSFAIAGVSSSGISGNKTSPLLDSQYRPANPGDYHFVFGGDVWIVKLNRAGEKLWDRSFGTAGDDFAGNMILNADGSLWISGRGFNGEVIPISPGVETAANLAWFSGAREDFLARMDSNGQASWQFFPGGDGLESLYELLPSANNGLMLVGNSTSDPGNSKQSPHYGDYDGWIAAVGADGVLQTDWSFGGSERDSFYSARRAGDGGLVLLGDSSSQNDGNRTVTNFGYSDLWVLRLNSSGDVMWERGLGGTGTEEVVGGEIVSETPDGGFIISGRSGSPPSGNKSSLLLDPYDEDIDSLFLSDIWVVKLSRNGDIEWNTSVGTSYPDMPQSVQPTFDGGVLISALASVYFYSWPPVETQFFTKISSNGARLWQLEFARPYEGSFRFATALPMPDGGAVLALSSSCIPTDHSFGAPRSFGAEDIWLIRVDANGRRLWDVTLGGNGMEYLSSLDRSRDGGFIVSLSSDTAVPGANGNKSHPGYGGIDMWIVKLSSELPPDSDGDGVPDDRDQCPNTVVGSIVNTSGCSIPQLAPCNGPWKNHGQYVAAVARACTQFRKAGVITHRQSLRIFLEAVKSDCGKRPVRRRK